MKRNEPNTAITAFGIDTEELTFGRDPTCSVRLYYPDVSLVHCKVVFEERKVRIYGFFTRSHSVDFCFSEYFQAYLVVLGTNGLLVDGCKVYANGSPSHVATPTTIPLSNNSEFEIHGKRFRFSYPPKELRAALMATPARTC
jgi:pSer/pThr/pTyr-binding forkhead associated (FHA) protein